MFVAYAVIALLLFSFGSLFYVYKFRGDARWENLSEYLRKGWPIFTPLNCFLYIFTKKRARKAIMDPRDFPEFDELQKNWPTIRDEALALHGASHFDQTKKAGSNAYYDIGFRTFYKYGWSKFYLKWYGYTHASAEKLCPKTVEILKKVPAVNGAMFSILPVGSKLTRHLDPVAVSLRYHLGLSTPNDDRCYISVDNQIHSWRDGQPLLFDETYLHYAHNDSEKFRIILMCDVERPMYWPGRVFNFMYKQMAKLTVVPNFEGDKRGLANVVFSSLSPLLAKTKALKQTNRPLYLAFKYTVNTTLLVIGIALIAGVIKAIQSLATLIVY